MIRRRGFLAATVGLSALGSTSGCDSADPSDSMGPETEGPTTVPIADIPIGGGVVLPDRRLVITRPGPSEFRAFTAVCTHQGCLVATVRNGTINCPCHGSAYAIEDGAVVRNPAVEPLTAVPFSVSNTVIVL